jgi:RND family efflux transporter MFP subunit
VTLLAPIGGVVADLSVTLGQVVERTAALMTVENLNAVVVQASVPEQDVARIHPGQRAEVTVAAYPDARFVGVVQSLASGLDEKTRTLAVRCLIGNEGGRLRPEMFAQVCLAAGGFRRALAVPAAALVGGDGGEGEGGRAVYVAGEKPGVFERRAVTVGRSYGDLVEVVNGLKPEDRVVTAGAFILKSEAQKGELKDED